MADQTLFEFPCDFPLKVLGRRSDDFRSIVLGIVQKHAGDIDPTLVRPIQGARHQSLAGTQEIEKKLVQHLKRRQETELGQISRARTAVLPGGKPRTQISAATMWVMPFLIPLWRMQPISKRNQALWGRLDNADKRRAISALPYNPQRIHTMLVNLRSIKAWSERDDAPRLHALRGVVLVPGDDQVLDPASMAASAERASPRLQVVHAPASSHFVLYDAPDLLALDATAERASAPGG